MRRLHVRCKHNIDHRMREKSTITKESYVFLNKSPLRNTSDITADTIAMKE